MKRVRRWILVRWVGSDLYMRWHGYKRLADSERKRRLHQRFVTSEEARAQVKKVQESSDRSVSDVFEALLRDQCGHGFAHTQQKIISWLFHCDEDAQQAFRKAVDETFLTAEEKVMREIFR